MKTDYKSEVKKIYPKAKCYNTGARSDQYAGNRSRAWEVAYIVLLEQGKIKVS